MEGGSSEQCFNCVPSSDTISRPLNSHYLVVRLTIFALKVSTQFISILCVTYLYYSYGHLTAKARQWLRGLHCNIFIAKLHLFILRLLQLNPVRWNLGMSKRDSLLMLCLLPCDQRT